jgi:hypothetical protein
MQDITRTADEISMYRAGLHAGMAAWARGETDHEAPMVSPSAIVQAYGDGYRDADDDSSVPRPSGPALDDPRGAVEPNDDETLDDIETRYSKARLMYEETAPMCCPYSP